VVLVIISLCSCSVTKRKYLPGFYVHRKGMVQNEQVNHRHQQMELSYDSSVLAAAVIGDTIKRDSARPEVFIKKPEIITLRPKEKKLQQHFNRQVNSVILRIPKKMKRKSYNKHHSEIAGDINGLFWIYLLAGVFIVLFPPLINLTNLVPWWMFIIDSLLWLGGCLYLYILVAWPGLIFAILGWNIFFIICFMLIAGAID
ncbi:MAG: hypothetical protein ACHQF2_08425, partial [Flavobacteriales bacterium]